MINCPKWDSNQRTLPDQIQACGEDRHRPFSAIRPIRRTVRFAAIAIVEIGTASSPTGHFLSFGVAAEISHERPFAPARPSSGGGEFAAAARAKREDELGRKAHGRRL